MQFIAIPTLYIYVPPCPACGSPRTGRYVRMTPLTEEYTLLEALRYGEIIRPAGDRKHLEGDFFCVSCGNIWRGKAEKRRLSALEAARERKLRGTDELYETACRNLGEITQRTCLASAGMLWWIIPELSAYLRMDGTAVVRLICFFAAL